MKKSNYSVLDLDAVRKKSSGIVPSSTILKDMLPIEWQHISQTGDKQNVSSSGHYSGKKSKKR